MSRLRSLSVVIAWCLAAAQLMGCVTHGDSSSVVWVEGEQVTDRSWTDGASGGDKAPASDGSALHGKNLDVDGRHVTWAIHRDRPTPDAYAILRVARLHWRDTMTPAAFTLTLAGGETRIERSFTVGNSRGWGNKPAEWRLVRVPLGDVPAGDLTFTLTAEADVNSISLDGFFLAPEGFDLDEAQLNALIRLDLTSRGYVGLKGDETMLDQHNTDAIAVVTCSFAQDVPPATVVLHGEDGQVHHLAMRAGHDWTAHYALPDALPDGRYTLEARSAALDATLRTPVVLVGQFIGELDRALPAIEAFAAQIVDRDDALATRLEADVAHAAASLRSGRDLLLSRVREQSVRRQHLIEAEYAGQPRQLVDNLKSLLAQTRQTMERVGEGVDPYAGRTGDFTRAMATVDGEPMVYRLFIPDGYRKVESVPLILMLHGGGGDENYFPDMADGLLLRKLNARGYIAISPRYHRRTMPQWDRKVLQLIDSVQADYPKVDPSRVYVTGISMGAGATYRLATHHRDRFAGAASVAGGGDPDTAESLRGLPLLLLHGDADAVNSPDRSRAMAERLEELGYPHGLHIVPGQGHGYLPETYLDLTIDFFERYTPR